MKEYSIVIGMDLGDRQNRYCVLDASGEVVQQDRVPCTEAELRKAFAGRESALFAIEAGGHSPWVSRVLEDMGHAVLVGHPRKLRAIYMNERKSDLRDAEMLARIARMDPKLLYPIKHRGKEAQAHLAVVKARAAAVEARTKLINHIRATVKSFGAPRLPAMSAPAFHTKVPEHLPKELRPALEPLLETVGKLTETIRDYDRKMDALCKKIYPETEVLQSTIGVGPVTSLAFVLTLEDPGRFEDSRDVPAYLGLVPRRDQSGATDRQLRITKAGNSYLRKLLVGCAQYILGPFARDSELRQWGLRLAARGGKNAKRRAVVAVARKLAVILHRLWQTGMLYEPFPQRPARTRA